MGFGVYTVTATPAVNQLSAILDLVMVHIHLARQSKSDVLGNV
nr:MAG TPA: hypothetical protein [Caudoviricetes sp.]